MANKADGLSPSISAVYLAFLETRLLWLGLAYAGSFLLVSALVPPINDYRAYLLQWQAVAAGQDPWQTPIVLGANAYGPLHNLYGLLFLIQPALPRLFGAGLWLAALWPIVRHIVNAPFAAERRLWLLLAVILNPFLWGWVAVFGSNDAIAAAFLVFAALALDRRASKTAGLCVALAALMKFYPLLVIPFVAYHRRRLDLPFAATALGVFTAGMGVAALLWGTSIFTPLFFAAGREPSQLSIYAFLATSALSPLHGIGVPTHLAQAIFAVVGLAAFGAHVQGRGGQREGLVLGLLVTLTGYQLGHFQFYLPLALLIPLTIAQGVFAPETAKWLLRVLATVSFFATCYLAFGGLVTPPWLYIRQNCGLPTFLIEVAALRTFLHQPTQTPSQDAMLTASA